MQLYEALPIFETTQQQLKELAAIRKARGDIVDTPIGIIASLVHLELIKEMANEKPNTARV